MDELNIPFEFPKQDLGFHSKCFRTTSKLQTLINPFQPGVAFDIETSHLFCSSKQMTGSYMKHNTRLEWVKGPVCIFSEETFHWRSLNE